MHRKYLSPTPYMMLLLIISLFQFTACNPDSAQPRKPILTIDTTSLPMLPTGYQSPRYHGLPQQINSAHDLTLLFDSTGSSLATVLETQVAKPFIFRNLPLDFKTLPVQEKTANFIALLMPHVLEVNHDILRVRDTLIAIQSRKKNGTPLTSEENVWIAFLSQEMRVKKPNIGHLLAKINTMPVSLVIAQAINESGWGTSRFAREGNALYGQHASRNGKLKYIVSKSGTAKVAAFDNIYLSTAGYILNINSNGAYKTLRALRQEQINKGKKVSGSLLATGLLHYSERGQDYVDELQAIIKRYELEKLNTCTLDTAAQLHYYQFTR